MASFDFHERSAAALWRSSLPASAEISLGLDLAARLDTFSFLPVLLLLRATNVHPLRGKGEIWNPQVPSASTARTTGRAPGATSPTLGSNKDHARGYADSAERKRASINCQSRGVLVRCEKTSRRRHEAASEASVIQYQPKLHSAPGAADVGPSGSSMEQ